MRARTLTAALVLALAAVVLSACGGEAGSSAPQSAGGTTPAGEPASGPPIRIGTKNFTEQYLLGELYAQALRAEGFRVEVKRDIGSSEIVHQALVGGGIDFYPEYVGVLLSEIAGITERPEDAEEAYRLAQEFEEPQGFALLEPTPFSDQNALAVLPATAQREGLRTVGDLAKLRGKVVIGAPPEFASRFEGLVGLRKLYDLENVSVEPMAIGSQYGALEDGEVDAAAVFTTDGRLAGGDYVLLEDPLGVFATQRVAPVIGRRVLEKQGPRLAQTINGVSARLTTEVMRRMNAEVDLRGRKPAEVAAEFLDAAR